MEEGGARFSSSVKSEHQGARLAFLWFSGLPLIYARWLPKGQTSHLHTTASQQGRRGGVRRAFSHATSFFVIMRKIFSRGSQQSSSYVLLAELSQWQGEESGCNWIRAIKSISWDFRKKSGVLISKGKGEKSAVLGGQWFLYIVFKPRLPSLPPLRIPTFHCSPIGPCSGQPASSLLDPYAMLRPTCTFLLLEFPLFTISFSYTFTNENSILQSRTVIIHNSYSSPINAIHTSVAFL